MNGNHNAKAARTDDLSALTEAFLADYAQKGPAVTDKEWLKNILAAQLPNVTAAEIDKFTAEIEEVTTAQEKLYAEVCAAGKTFGWSEETWLYHKLMNHRTDNDNDFSKTCLRQLKYLSRGNEDLMRHVEKIHSLNADDDDFDEQAASLLRSSLTKQTPAAKRKSAAAGQSAVLKTGLTNSLSTQLHRSLAHSNIARLESTEIAHSLTRNATMAGVGGVAVTAGFAALACLRQGAVSGAVQQQMFRTLLKSGINRGMRTAVVGALRVGAERNMLPLLARGTPAVAFVAVAAVGIESAKVFIERATGNLTNLEALDRAGRVSVSGVATVALSHYGGMAGAACLSAIPGVGMIVGGMLGYAIGNAIGQHSYTAAKTAGMYGLKTARNASYVSVFIVNDIAKSFARATTHLWTPITTAAKATHLVEEKLTARM